jgi:acetyltransferase-like isoleucine patch superfamily enzyme
LNLGLLSIFSEPLATVAALLAASIGKDFEGSRGRFRGWLTFPSRSDRRLSIGPHCTFFGKHNIQLAESVTFHGNAFINAGGGEQGFVRIGRNTHIDQFCTLYGIGGLSIGADCAIASGVIIYTQTNQYASDPEAKIVDQPVIYKPVVIGDDVWIGAGAVILPGVNVGSHSIIAAGGVVRHDVAEWTIVGGVPAKVIGNRRTGKKLTLRLVSEES